MGLSPCLANNTCLSKLSDLGVWGRRKHGQKTENVTEKVLFFFLTRTLG